MYTPDIYDTAQHPDGVIGQRCAHESEKDLHAAAEWKDREQQLRLCACRREAPSPFREAIVLYSTPKPESITLRYPVLLALAICVYYLYITTAWRIDQKVS